MSHTQAFRAGETQPHVVSTHLGGRVLVAAGDMVYAEPRRITQPIGDGLRIVVVLDGVMRLRAGDAPALEVEGPTSLAICSDGEAERDQTFAGGRPFRCVLVQIDRELVVAERGTDPNLLLRASPGRHHTSQLVFNTRRRDPAASALAAQLLSCPETRDRDLFRLTKALELTSVVLDGFDAERALGATVRLGAAEAERIRAARTLLLADLEQAPDMTTLASRTGLNPLKLTRGFRAVYGTTPYALLQEHRLQTAYRMLTSAGGTVGQAAAATGYTQAHFATLFRRRFGLSPSALLPKGTAADAKSEASNDPNFVRTQ